MLQRFITWREKHIKDKQFILILSLLVGVFTALAAYVLKFLVEYIKELLTDWFNPMEANWLYLVYPVVGILLTSLFIRKVVRDDISHGVTKILYAISRKQSRIKRHNMWSSVCASAITIGCGGSVGAEAPIVLTGSAIGSNLGSLFRLDHKTLMLLVGCGAAGAVSGIFKAPIAGLVFTLEVLMIDLTMASLLPLLITSVTAASVSYLLTGTAVFAGAHSACHCVGNLLRISGMVFHPRHELDREYLPALFQSVCQVCDRRNDAEYLDIPFPSALR